jgi:hypothetical protein
MATVVGMAAVASLLLAGCGGPSADPGLVPHRTPAHGRTHEPPAATSTTTSLPSATPTTVLTPVTPAPGWAAPLTALPPGGGFTSVSCLSDTFCIAAGGGDNQADIDDTAGAGVSDSWDGAAWADPSVYFPAPTTGTQTAPIMPAITCTAGPLCVIVDGTDHVSSGNGTDWSAPSALSPGPGPTPPANPADPGAGHPGSRHAAVSCPAPTFCAAVDNTGHAAVLVDGHWTSLQGLPAGPSATAPYVAGPVGLSCPTTSACLAVVGPNVFGWDGTSWAKQPSWTTPSAGGATGAGVSCPEATLCWLVSGKEAVEWSAAGQWLSPQTIDPAGDLDAVSCPTVTFCVAADTSGSVATWNGTAWSLPRHVLPAPTEYTGDPSSVSCPDAQFCMVLDGDGDYTIFTGAASTGRPGPPATAGPVTP